MDTRKRERLTGAMAFITLMGIVSLFSDMTHEGARSILGEYLNLAGASAAAIGFVSGVGELCGVGMDAKESIMKAAVTRVIPRAMRSTGFGIFETGFGIAWFLGSWLLGVLYDISLAWLAAVSVFAQVLSMVFYGLCIRQQKQEA